MKKLLWAGLVGLAGLVVHNVVKQNAENKKRISTPCNFTNGITQSEFAELVASSAKSIKRITNLSVDRHMVYCTVSSNSSLSSWKFNLDFNDYGNMTGEYWYDSDNSDSSIPKCLGDRIRDGIRDYYSSM